MTRMSKDSERRGVSPRRPKRAGKKSGPKKDNTPEGYRVHPNALEGTALGSMIFISKVK